MKMKHIFLKYYKKTFIFVLFLLILIVPSFLHKENKITAEINCILKNENDLSCTFDCNITPYMLDGKTEEVNVRIMIIHSYWSAIFDKTYNMKTNVLNKIEVTIPRRNYKYLLNGNLYKNEDVGSLNEVKYIYC